MLTDQELQTLRNMGNEGKAAADEIVRLRAAVAEERRRCADYLMQQAMECPKNGPTRATLESCSAVLRLGLVDWA